jgi:hypothetical protein
MAKEKDYQRLYDLAMKRVAGKRKKANAKDAADVAAGRPRKLREDLRFDLAIEKKFSKMANKYDKKNNLIGGLDSPRYKVRDEMRKKLSTAKKNTAAMRKKMK